MSLPPTVPASAANSADATQWFRREVEPHGGQLKAYLRNRFPSVSDVDDVVQESYLRIWRARARVPILSAKAFLYRVAQNLALKIIRKNRNAPFVALRDFDAVRVIEEAPDAAEALIIHERIELLADALMSLPPRCREVTLLHKIHGISQREVADRLNLSERTVETQIRIGVARCLTFLQERSVKSIHGDEA